MLIALISISLLPSLFLSIYFLCHLLLPLPFLIPTLPVFAFISEKSEIQFLRSTQKKKIHCFDKCFKSTLLFIALRQIIDE